MHDYHWILCSYPVPSCAISCHPVPSRAKIFGTMTTFSARLHVDLGTRLQEKTGWESNSEREYEVYEEEKIRIYEVKEN